MNHSMQDVSSAYDRAVRHGATEWDRLAREEAAERAQRSVRRRLETRRRTARSGPVVTVVKVVPAVMRAALRAAGGDASRLRIVSDTEVWVH